MSLGNLEVIDSLVAGIGVLAGVLLTLGTEFARRRWEDQRRWLDVKRKAYFTFLLTSNALFYDIEKFARVKNDISEVAKGLATLEDQVANGNAGPDQVAEMKRLKSSIASARERQGRLEPRVEEAMRGLKEAEADMVLLSSEPLLEAARSHRRLVFLFHDVFVAAAQEKIKPQAVSDKFASDYDQSLEGLKKLMRKEINVK